MLVRAQSPQHNRTRNRRLSLLWLQPFRLRRNHGRRTQNTAGSAAVLGAPMGAGGVAEAQTKATQKAVGYQDTPKGAQRCDNCRQFEPPASCKTVEGKVSPAGWCKVYVKKPA